MCIGECSAGSMDAAALVERCDLSLRVREAVEADLADQLLLDRAV